MFFEYVSGESVDEFYERNGIDRSQFFYWQRKLREIACNRIDEATAIIVPSGWVA